MGSISCILNPGFIIVHFCVLYGIFTGSSNYVKYTKVYYKANINTPRQGLLLSPMVLLSPTELQIACKAPE